MVAGTTDKRRCGRCRCFAVLFRWLLLRPRRVSTSIPADTAYHELGKPCCHKHHDDHTRISHPPNKSMKRKSALRPRKEPVRQGNRGRAIIEWENIHTSTSQSGCLRTCFCQCWKTYTFTQNQSNMCKQSYNRLHGSE